MKTAVLSTEAKKAKRALVLLTRVVRKLEVEVAMLKGRIVAVSVKSEPTPLSKAVSVMAAKIRSGDV